MRKIPLRRKLPLSFYVRPTEEVAKGLLGKVLVHRMGRELLSGRIVETEAYLGAKDPACHSYPNRRTARTSILFGPGGYSYVYFIYGVYYCFNVVTEQEGVGEAVLVRALEPLEGIEKMKKLRSTSRLESLCSGPGKLCQALGIGRKENGLPLNGDRLWIEDGPAPERVITCTRIGIAQPEARDLPLRFYDADSPHVSKRSPTHRK